MITLVKFEASWCGPCKAATDVMNEVVPEVEKDVVYTLVDIDDNPQLRIDHHVTSIPTFIIFKSLAEGEPSTEMQRMQGCGTADEMKAWIKSFITETEGEQGDIQLDLFQEQS